MMNAPCGWSVRPSPTAAKARSLRNDDDRCSRDGVELADLIARPALDALALVEVMRLRTGAGDGLGRADLDAHLAPRAAVGESAERDELAADGPRAAAGER